MMKGMVKTDAMIIERTNIVYTSFKGSVSWTIKAFPLQMNYKKSIMTRTGNIVSFLLSPQKCK